MGLLRQFGLLLQRYLIIRKRQPVILVLEVLWPLLTFLVVAVVRQGALPVSRPNCHYAERALPNAGLLPFVQSYVCNMNNDCQTEDGLTAARQRREMLTGLMDDLGPHLANSNVTDALKSLKNATVLLETLDKGLSNQKWLSDYMKNGIPIRELLRDPGELKRNLVTENRYLEGDVFDAILNASLKIDGIVRYLGDFNGTAVLCSATELKHYLIFEEGADFEAVSKDLCTLNTSVLPELMQTMQNHLDVVKIVKWLSKVPGDYTIQNGFNDLSLLLDLILNNQDVKNIVNPEVFKLVDVLKMVPEWIEKFKVFSGSQTDVLNDVVMELDDIIRNLSNNSEIWDHIKGGVHMISDFIHMFLREKFVGGGTGGLALKLWFTDPSEVEELLKRAGVSKESIKSLMNKAIPVDQVTPFLLSTDAEDLLRPICHNIVSSDLSAVVCNGTGLIVEEFVELISLSQFKEQALEAFSKDVMPVEDLIKQGIHYLDVFFDVSPDLMNALGAVSSISLGDTLRALEMMVAGNTTEQDFMRKLSSSLGGLDRVLDFLPSANTTRILIAVADTCLSAVTEVVTTITEMENFLARLTTGDLHLVSSVNELLALGPQVTRSVLQAFTDPKKVQMLLNKTDNLGSVYCDGDKLSQFLDIPRSEVLDKLQGIFCTDNVTEISRNLLARLHLEELQHIFKEGIDEVDSYIHGLKDLTSSRFNISALVWKSVTFYNSVRAAEQSMVQDWTSLIKNVSRIHVDTREWRQVWSNLKPKLWTAGFAMAVETWGPVLEETALWPMVGPVLRSAVVVMEDYIGQMLAMNDIFGADSRIGQIAMDVMKYLPEMMGGLLSVAENPTIVTRLVTAGNLSAILCDAQQLRTMITIPDYVPLDEMLANICSLDLDKLMQHAAAVNNFMSPAMYEKINMLMKNEGGNGTARGFDWSRMVDDVYKVYTMAQDPLHYTEVIRRIVTLYASNVNLDKYWERFENFSGQEYARLAAFMVSYGLQIDRMFGNNSVWKLAKSYILLADQYLETFNKNGFQWRILDIFPNATKLNKLVMSVGGAVPDLMEALKNQLLHPYKLSQKLLSMNVANNTVCDGLMISSLLDIEDPSRVQAVEQELCRMDWVGLLQEMATNPAQEELNKAIVAMHLGKPLPNVSLNWTRIAQNVYTYVTNLFSYQNLMAPGLEGFGLNQTAIEMRFRELTNASQVYTDPARVSELTTDFFPLMEMLADTDPSLAAVWKMEKIYVYIVNQFIMLANKNLPRFQGKAEVNLLHFLDSEELDKIAMALSASPDLVQVLLDTLLDVMLDTAKAATFGNVQELMRVCSDPVAFNYFFPKAAHVQLDIRGTICNASLVNTTKLVQELESSIGGLSQMVQAISQVLQPNVEFSDIHLNMSAVSKNSEQFISMIMELVKNPPVIDMGLGTRWMNGSVWDDLLYTYGDKFLDAFRRYETMSVSDVWNLTLASVEQQLMQYVVYPEFNEVMGILGYTARQGLQAMDTLLAKNSTSLKGFLSEYPTIERVFELSDSLPQILATLIYTNAFNPMALSSMFQTVDSWGSFCALDISSFIQNVPGLNFDISTFQPDLCDLNITQLIAEGQALTGTTDLMTTRRIVNVTSDWLTNVRSMQAAVRDTGRLLKLYLDVLQKPPLQLQTVFSWLNKTVWETTFGGLGQQLADPGTTLRMLESLDQLTSLLDNISRTDQFLGYMWQAQKIQMYILNEVIKLANKNLPRFEGKVNLLDFFRSEELEKIAEAVKASPEVVKLLFDTFLDIMANPVKSSKFSDPQKLGQLCLDKGAFSELFPASITSQVDLQGVICNLTYINGTRLAAELQDGVYGLSQMVQTLTRVAQGSARAGELHVSYKAMSKNYKLFVEILTNLTQRPPQVDLGLGRQWDNASRWNQLWTDFSDTFVNISTHMQAQGWEDIITSLLSALEMQLRPLYRIPGFTDALNTIYINLTPVYRALQVMSANSTADLMTKWSEFPEMQKMYQLLDQVPYLLMSLLDPSAGNAVRPVTEAYATVNTFEEFCAVDFDLDTVFPGLPNMDGFSPNGIKQAICRVNYTALELEAQQFFGIQKPNYTITRGTTQSENSTISWVHVGRTYEVTVSDVISTVVKTVDTVQRLTQDPLTFPLFSGQLWDKWFSRMAATYQNGSLQSLLDKALSLRPTLQSILTSPIGRNLSPGTLRGLEGLISFLTDFIKMVQVGKLPNVWKMYEKVPLFHNLVQLSNMAPNVLDVFLDTLMDPVKGQRLMVLMANPNSTLETFCNLTRSRLEDIFVRPVNTSLSLNAVQSLVCSLDLSSLGAQLANVTSTNYKFISDLVLGSKGPTGQLLNITDFLNDVDYLQAALSNITYNSPDPRLFQQLNLTEYFPFYNLFMEETWKPFYDRLAAKLTTNPGSLFDVVKALRPVLAAVLQTGDPGRISVLIGLDGAMTYLTDYIMMLQEGKLADPWEVLRGAPSLQKIFSVLDQGPELLEVIIETMLSPTKSQRFLSLFVVQPWRAFSTFCSEPDLLVYFEKPSGPVVDLDAVRQAICSVKLEEIGEELENSSISNLNFVSRMMMPWNLTLDVDMFYQHLEEFQAAFNNLTLNPPDASKFTTAQLNSLLPFMGLFDQLRWSQMFDRVYRRMASRAMDPFWYGEVYSQQLSQLMNMLPPGERGLVRAMNILMEIYGVILDKSQLLNDKTSFRLADLFPASPTIQQLANFLDSSPELVEMILSSVDTPQFAQLYTMTLDQALQEICQQPESYLTLSPQSGETVEGLMSQFCAVNLTALVLEFEEELHLPTLTQASSNMTFNLTTYIQVTVKLMNSTWTRPAFPELNLDKWTNKTFWTDVFTRYSQMISNPSQEIELLMKAVLPLILPANDSSFQALAVVMEEVTRVINAKLTMLTNGTLSLDTLFDDAPRVKRLLEESLGIAPDLLHAVFSATISKPDTLFDLITAPDWKARICGQPGALQGMFNLPLTVNASEVQRVVCTINETLLASDVIHMLGIDRIQTKLQALHEGRLVINWEEVFAQSNQLYTAIDKLIRHPPRVQLPVINMQALDRLAHTFLEEMNDPNRGLTNYIRVLNILNRYLNGTEGWAYVTSYYRAAEILTAYMNRMLAMLMPSGQKVDLAALFGSSPHVRRLLDLVFHMGPDFLNGFLSAEIKPEMISIIAAGKFDPDTQLCSESDMRRYFSFHPSFNLSYAIAALCHFNSSQVLSELTGLFDIRHLGDQLARIGTDEQKFDPVNLIRQSQEFSVTLAKLFNATGLTFDNVDVIKYMQFNGSIDAFLQNSLVMALSNNVTSYADLLQLMMPMIEKTEFWHSVRPVLNALNILTDVLNRKLTIIETQPITLENLVKNATHVRQVLEKGFGVVPHIATAMMQSTANITAYLPLVNSIADIPDIPDFSKMSLEELMNYTFPTYTPFTMGENFCVLNMVTLPPWVNTTALRDLVCTFNATVLLQELKNQISYDKLINEFAKIGRNISEPFSWQQFLANIQTLQVKLGQLPKVNINVPVFPDFLAALFSYQGDMEEWLARLEQAAYNYPNGSFDGLEFLKVNLHNFLSSLWVGAMSEKGTPNKTVVHILTAFGKLLTLMEGQMTAVEKVNLKAVFKYSEVRTDPHALLSGDTSVIDQFLSMNFRPGKWAELRNASSKNALLCGTNAQLDQVFELPAVADPRLLTLINRAFCNKSIPAYSQIQDALSTYDHNRYMVDVISQVIGSPAYNSTENYASVLEKTMELLDLILPWQVQRGQGVSPALTQLLHVWQRQTPRFNAKLYAAGVNILLSLLERGSQTADGWLRAGEGIRIILDMITSTLHSLTGDPVDLSRLFRDNSPLINYINTTLASSTTFMQAMLEGKVRLDKLLPLLSRPNGKAELCQREIFEQVFTSNDSRTQEDMYMAVCQNASQLFHGLSKILNIDINTFMAQLSNLFAPSVPAPMVDWEGLYLKTDTLVGMVLELASQGPAAFLERVVQHWTGTQNNLMQILDKLQKGDPQLLTNLVTMLGQTLGRLDTNHYLYPIFQFLDGPVLQQVAQQVKMFRDLLDANATDALAAFVNIEKTARDQLRELASLNLIQETVCDVDTVRGLLHGQYTNASAVSAAMCGQSADSWYNNLLALRMGPLDVITLSSMLQGHFFTHAFNNPHQNPPLNALDWSKFGQHLQGLLSDLGMSPSSSERNWESIITEVGMGSLQALISVVDILNFADPFIQGPDWKDAKQYIQSFSYLVGVTNDLLDGLTASNSSLKLIKLYAEPIKVQAMVTSLVGAEPAAQFLAASVNAGQLLSLVHRGSLRPTVCDQASFDKTFRFEPGVESSVLRGQLCQVARSNASLADKLVSMLDAQSVVQEAMKMTGHWRNQTVLTGWDLWNYVKLELQRLKDTLGQLWKTYAVDTGQPNSGMKIIVDILEGLSTNSYMYSQSCHTMLSLLESHQSEVRPILSMVMTSLRLLQEEIKVTLDFDQIVCSLHGKKLHEIVRDLADINFFGLIDMYVNSTTHHEPFTCDQMGQLVSQLFNSKPSLPGLVTHNYTNTGVCLPRLLKSTSEAIGNIDSIFEMMSEVLEILEDKNLAWLGTALNTNLKPAIPYIELFLKAALGQQDVVLSLSHLLENSTQVAEHLVDVLQYSPQIIRNLFNSTLNLDIVRVLNMPAQAVKDILCKPDELSKYLTLPNGVNLTVGALSRELCNGNLTDAISVVQSALDVGRIALELSKVSTGGVDVAWYKGLASHISSLMTNIQGISKVFKIFTADQVNWNEALPEIQRILKTTKPQEIINSLDLIIQDLEAVTSDPKGKSVLKTLQTVNKGLMASDLIARFFMPDIKDMLTDPDSFRRYLTDELHFKPEVAKALLNAAVSFKNHHLVHNVTEIVCHPENLTEILVLDQSGRSEITVDDVSLALCSLKTDELANVTQIIFRALDLGDILHKFLLVSMDSILQDSDLDMKDAEAVFKELEDAEDDLKEMSEKLKDMVERLNLSDLLPSPQALTSSSGINVMSSLLCGNASGIGDEFQLSGVVKVEDDHIDKGLSGNERKEVYAMPTLFCRDILRMMYKSTGSTGSILWTYLKPLIRGKIPFYPSTPEVMSIIKKANSTFEMLYDVNRMAHKWAQGSEDLKTFVQKLKQQNMIMSLLSSPEVSRMIEQSLGLSGASITESLKQMTDVPDNQLELLYTGANLLANLTDCLSFDRFEEQVNNEGMFRRSEELTIAKEMLAAVEFVPLGSDMKRKKRAERTDTVLKNVIYKIRMDLDNVPTTTFLKNPVWRPVAEDNFADDLRYLRGFVQLQEMIDRAIIQTLTGDDGQFPTTYLQQFPFPCHEQDVFLHYLSYYLLPLMMTLAWIGSLGIAIKVLLYDRETGIEETLKVMGLKSGVNWLAWLLVTMLFMLLVAGLEVLILKLSSILRFSDWVILLILITDFCFSSLMMCYMVSAFFTRANMAALTALIVYLLSYLPFVMATALEHQMTFTEKMLACLSSTSAFGFACQFMSRFEEQLVGIQWNNTWVKVVEGDDMNFSWTCIMMAVDGVIYLIIGWYVRNVIPRKYGVPLPWYFPVHPKYWGCVSLSKQKQQVTRGINNGVLTDCQLIESTDLLSHQDVGISLQNLSKAYGGTPAVNHLSVNIYKGQITSLLGHNGAGKTTTINMLTGVIRPTDGTALVNGLNIYTDLDKIRRDVGICPQHNTLFDFMTVKEHLELFMGLKGNFSGKSAKEEIHRMLDCVDLYDQRYVPVEQLSGGMKRRLCVALAFVGGSDTVILDEPTSGVDPNARRGVWDVILHNRANRTILLSTHHLDEADILSDRIAILHNGRLLCCGSSMFLKKQLGSGYHLTAVSDTDSASQSSSSAKESDVSDTTSNLMSLIRKYIPNAEVQEEMGTEVKVNLLASDAEKQNFPHMFLELDEHLPELGIRSYGVSETTLEEVFLKACYLADHGKSFTRENLRMPMKESYVHGSLDMSSNKSSHWGTSDVPTLVHNAKRVKRYYGMGLKLQHFKALWLKRLHHYRRDWRLLFTLIILPMIFVATGMGFALIQKALDNAPPLVLTPAMYGEGQFAFIKQNAFTEMFDNMVESLTSEPGFGTVCMPAMKNWSFITEKFECENHPDEQNLTTVEGDKSVVCKCTDYRYHCDGKPDLPPQRLTKTGVMLQNISEFDIDRYLLDSHLQFRHKRYGGWSYEDGNKATVWFNNKGHHAMPAYLNTLSNAVLRSRVNASQRAEYGITTINHPYRLTAEPLSRDTVMQKAGETGISMVILLAFSFIVASFIIYVVDERIRKEKRLQHISGVTALTYWSVTLVWDMMIYAITVGLAVGIMAIFHIPSYWEKDNLPAVVILLLLFGASATNMMYMTSKLFNTAATAYMTLFCVNMLIGLITSLTVFLLSFFTQYQVISQVYDIIKYVFMIFPQFCLGEGLVRITKNQLMTDLFERFGEDVYKSPYSMDFLGWLYVAMAIQTVVFFIITLLTEIRPRPLFRNKRQKVNIEEDSDVRGERERVAISRPSDYAVMANNLSKLYLRGLRKVVAVDNVSFAVQSGECFGLLGVNGAGKTSTFKMLIGDTDLSGGDAYLNGKSVQRLSGEQRQAMGYCPQSDALDDFVSGRELLFCHARLKGSTSSDAKQMISALSMNLDMGNFLDHSTKTYSGGMKRKLSLAIAVIGRPDVIYLDEPTAGMDPVNKRLVWNLILDLVKGGTSIILTSHSMAECDILCNRVAIMVNGRFVCMGSPQHLKHKFSEGYRVIIKVKGPQSNAHAVLQFMLSTFPGTVLKDQHNGTLEFAIPLDSAHLPNIFGHLERQRHELDIEDYSVQQTTLDAVFLQFAKNQTDGITESPDGSVTDTDVEVSKSKLQPHLGLSGPFVNESYAFMNPQVHDTIELQPSQGYLPKNIQSSVSRQSSLRSEKGKINPLYPMLEESEVTHL